MNRIVCISIEHCGPTQTGDKIILRLVRADGAEAEVPFRLLPRDIARIAFETDHSNSLQWTGGRK